MSPWQPWREGAFTRRPRAASRYDFLRSGLHSHSEIIRARRLTSLPVCKGAGFVDDVIFLVLGAGLFALMAAYLVALRRG